MGLRWPLAAALVVLWVGAGCSAPRSVRLPSIGPRSAPDRPGTEVVVSWYGNQFAGQETASGERFDPEALTAAHRHLPFGTTLRLRNPKTGATVMVTVNDRGPWEAGRDLDLSLAAARSLGIVSEGVASVELEVVDMGSDERERATR